MPFDRRLTPAVVVGLMNVFAIGFGMGVPIFAVLLGLPVGWWLVRGKRGSRIGSTSAAPDAVTTAQPVTMYAAADDVSPVRRAARSLLAQAFALATVTLVAMVVIWGQYVPGVFDSAVDATGAGIPLILYSEQAPLVPAI